MVRICLLTPGHLSTNPRIVKEADALVEAGHDVQVIACDYATWAREADAEFAYRLWRVPATLRFGPQAPPYLQVKQQIRRRLARLLFRLGLRGQKIECAASHAVAPDLAKSARRVRADLYVAHYVAALPAAAQAAGQHGARYAFDAEDFHLGDLPEQPEHAFEKRLIRSIESRHLPGCAHVTAASPGIADAYEREYGIKPPTVVLNVSRRAQGVAAPTQRGSASPGPSVYWFSQTIGPNRGLECAVRAIGRTTSKPHLYLQGNASPPFVSILLRLAIEDGVAQRLHFLPPSTPSELARSTAAYDLGLSGEPGHTYNNQIALGNKLFTYFSAGLPILMSDVQGHTRFFPEIDGAAQLYRAGDPTALAEAIDRWLMDGRALASAREAAWRLSSARFNWDFEKRVLLEAFQSISFGNSSIATQRAAVEAS